MGFERNDGVIVLDTESLPSALIEDSTEVKDIRDLDMLGTPRRHECETQSVDTSSRLVAMSHVSPSHPLVAIRLGNPRELKRICDTIVGPNRNRNIASPRILDEALSHECGSFSGALEDECAPNERSAEPNSPVSLQASESATGSDVELLEYQIDGIRSLRLATPYSPSERVRGPGTTFGSAQPIYAEHFWDDTGRRSSCKGRQIGSMSRIAWTNDADKHLLHLRNVAQLNWQTLVTYFPGTTPDSVRQRYQQLKKMETVDQAMDDDRSSQCCEGSVTHLLSDLSYGKAQAPMAKTPLAEPASQRKRAAFAPRYPARRRRPNAQADRVEPALPSTLSADGVAQQRTSRCGRTIRHPFRHRLSEGYL